MNPVSRLVFCLVLVALSATTGAVRYLGNPEEVKPIQTLLTNLRHQYQSLEKLMGMLDRLGQWQKQLEAENQRLAREGELAKADKVKLDEGRLSQEEINRKWHESGRSLAHDRELKSFQSEVARFNDYVRDYNSLTEQLAEVLANRTPRDVIRLMGDIRMLDENLQQALDEGNIEKAKYIARRSDIAMEFGYQSN